MQPLRLFYAELAQAKPFIRVLDHFFTLFHVINPINIRHEHARFAWDIGTLVPVVTRIPQRLIGQFLDPQMPWAFSFDCCFDGFVAIFTHVVETLTNPIHMLFDAWNHVG